MYVMNVLYCLVAIMVQHVDTDNSSSIRFCYFEETSKEISCRINQLIYITLETYGWESIGVQRICLGVDTREGSCLSVHPNVNRFLTTASNCNGKNKCTLHYSDVRRLLTWEAEALERDSKCNISASKMAIEVHYSCIPDTSVHIMCEEDDIAVREEKMYVLAKQSSRNCMCRIYATNMFVRALDLRHSENAFQIFSNNGLCNLSASQLYNNNIDCGVNVSFVTVKIKNDFSTVDTLWLRVNTGGRLIRIKCNRSQNASTVSPVSTLPTGKPADVSPVSTPLTGNPAEVSPLSTPSTDNPYVVSPVSTPSTDNPSVETPVSTGPDNNAGNMANVNFSTTVSNQREIRDNGVIVVAASLSAGCCFLAIILFISILCVKRKRRLNLIANQQKEIEPEQNNYGYMDVDDTPDNIKKDKNVSNKIVSKDIETEYNHLNEQTESRNIDLNHYDHCNEAMTSGENQYNILNLQSTNNKGLQQPVDLYDHVTVSSKD